jgi:hypothetical protein
MPAPPPESEPAMLNTRGIFIILSQLWYQGVTIVILFPESCAARELG